MARKKEEALQKGHQLLDDWDGRVSAIFDLRNFGWSNIDYASQVGAQVIMKHQANKLEPCQCCQGSACFISP